MKLTTTTVFASCFALNIGCQFGERVEYDVEHGYADRRVMAADPEGEHVLTSDVDAKLFRIFKRDGTQVGSLPWASAGYTGGDESVRGPFNGAATGYGLAGFFVAGGDSKVHWIFPFAQGTWGTVVWDEVPLNAQTAGRVKVCDMTSGPDGSWYVLTGERTGLLDRWALGAAWIYKRAPDGVWSSAQLSLHTLYTSSLCGRVAFDVLSRRLLFVDMYRDRVRRFDESLTEVGSFPLPGARSVIDMDTLSGYTYVAACGGAFCGTPRLRIYNGDGVQLDSRTVGEVHAIAVERPPLPIGADQEAWLWTVGGVGDGAPLIKYKLETE